MRIPQFTLMSATCDTGHLPSLNFPFSSVSVSAIKQDKAVVLVLEYCFKVTFEAKTSFFNSGLKHSIGFVYYVYAIALPGDHLPADSFGLAEIIVSLQQCDGH